MGGAQWLCDVLCQCQACSCTTLAAEDRIGCIVVKLLVAYVSMHPLTPSQQAIHQTERSMLKLPRSELSTTEMRGHGFTLMCHASRVHLILPFTSILLAPRLDPTAPPPESRSIGQRLGYSLAKVPGPSNTVLFPRSVCTALYAVRLHVWRPQQDSTIHQQSPFGEGLWRPSSHISS